MIGEALNKHWKPPTPPFMQQLEGGKRRLEQRYM